MGGFLFVLFRWLDSNQLSDFWLRQGNYEFRSYEALEKLNSNSNWCALPSYETSLAALVSPFVATEWFCTHLILKSIPKGQMSLRMDQICFRWADCYLDRLSTQMTWKFQSKVRTNCIITSKKLHLFNLPFANWPRIPLFLWQAQEDTPFWTNVINHPCAKLP